MRNSLRVPLRFYSAISGVALAAWLLPVPASADQIPANADAFMTTPGSASIVLNLSGGPQLVALEGATEFSTPQLPLTAAEVTRLNALAPNLSLVSYQLQWVDQHGSVVGPTSAHKVVQVLMPVLNTLPNFDTVVARKSNVTLAAGGQVGETPLQILMLDLQSVSPILIGGFHYEGLVRLANGSPVCTNPCMQFDGNLKIDSTSVDSAGIHGTLDLGVTGPTPTAANLGADLPSGMEGLPVSFDLQFIPLDGGPALPDIQQESIFQNTSASSIKPVVPEPASLTLLGIGLIGIGNLVRRKR